MPKDYKDAPGPRESRLAHPMLLGMIIGLLLGVVISLAVALWLNRLSNPFVEKGKQVEPVAKFSPAQPPAPAEGQGRRAGREGQAPAAPADREAAKPAEHRRFEFYRSCRRKESRTRTRAQRRPTRGPRGGNQDGKRH